MRILFATPVGLPGGISRWAEHILSYYNGVRSCEIDLLPMVVSKNSKDALRNNLYHRIKKGLIGYYKIAQQEKTILQKKSYDLIHIASSASISLAKDLYMVRIAHKKGVKAIVHFHFGRIPELRQYNNWEWKLLCKVVKKADTVVVIDKVSYDTLLQAGFTNVRLLPNPVAPKVLEIAECEEERIRKEREILFVGHGYRTKGIYELVDACRDIQNVKVKMLGTISDTTRDNLLKYSNNAEWLEIVGEKPYEEVIKEMCKCDVFVLPTYTEGFPNVILESMACGCAIVTTPVGAIPEMLEEENGKHYGIMVEPRNVEQLKGAIEKMLSDVDFKNKCRENVQQRVIERYNIDSVWRQMVDIWQSLLLRTIK